MKFTKLVPIALALSLISPAFAADNASSNLDLTMPAFIDIAKDEAHSVYAETATVDYVAGTINALTLKAAWNVTTNVNNDAIYLSAKSRENSADKTSLYGDDSNLYLIFTNIGNDDEHPGDGPAAGTLENIIKASGSAGGSVSPDSIVFNLGEKFTPSGAASADPTKSAVNYVGAGATTGSKARKYVLHNGTYNIVNAVGTVYNSSFDTNDTAGIYRATLYLTHAAP